MMKKIISVGIICLLILVTSSTIVSREIKTGNQPPEPPSLCGPSELKVGVNYNFIIFAEDPDGDNVSYSIDWGDGTNFGWTDYFPSGTEIETSHNWSEKGDYFVVCKAKDIHGAESSKTYWFVIGKSKPTIIDNHPPDKPSIDGPQFGRPGTYTWTFKAIDPDGDNVSYQVDWDDGEISGWTDWYQSGEEITQSHYYSEQGTFSIRGRAKDIHGAVGEWGDIHFGVPTFYNDFEIEVEYRAIEVGDVWYIEFEVTSNQVLDRVMFYIDNSHHETVVANGEMFVIFSPIRWHDWLYNSEFLFFGYNFDGDYDIEIVDGSDIKSYPTPRGEIEYPKGEGPYLIMMGGEWLSNGVFRYPIGINFTGGEWCGSHIAVGPLYMTPLLEIYPHEGCYLMINGDFYYTYELKPWYIEIYNFIGFHPGFIQWSFNMFYLGGRVRTIGICSQVDLINAGEK